MQSPRRSTAAASPAIRSEPAGVSLGLESARVLADGRILRTLFTVRPAPDRHGFPDWMPGFREGLRLTLSNGAECAPLGVLSESYNLWRVDAEPVSDPNSRIPPGQYFFRLTIADANGVDIYVSDLAGVWGSHEYAYVVKPEQALRFKWQTRIPEGYTGRIYANTIPGDQEGTAESLRLLRDKIPSGTTELRVADMNFADRERAPDSLRSWMVYWLVPEIGTVTFDESIRASGPAGLVRDEHGNRTALFNDVAVENLSMVDSDGWTSTRFQRSPEGVELYVSSTHGDDRNPGTRAQPKKTLGAAWSALPARSGSVVRLLRGDTFPIGKSLSARAGLPGQRRTPLILEDYWEKYGGLSRDPGTRPVVRCEGCDFWTWHLGATRELENILVRRVTIQEGAVMQKAAVNWHGMGRNIVFSDVLFDNATFAPQSLQGFSSFYVTLHRSIVRDNNSTGAHVSGVYAQGVQQLLLSQCVIDRNGYASRDYSHRTMFDHNIYLQNGTVESVTWGCWITRGGCHAIQARGGGVIAYSILARNQAGGTITRHSGWYHRCVWLDIESTKIGGLGPDFGQPVVESDSNHVCLEFSILAHRDQERARTVQIGFRNKFPERTRRYGVVRHCLVVDADQAVALGANPPSVAAWITRNVFINDGPSGNPLYGLGLSSGNDLKWLKCDENVYYAASKLIARQRVGNANKDFSPAAWRQLGQDGHSIVLTRAPRLANSEFGLSDYTAAQHGPTTDEAMLEMLRNRPPGVWWELFDARRAYEAFAAAYRAAELPTLGRGPLDYYGPSGESSDRAKA
jgi:hypothetical protein